MDLRKVLEDHFLVHREPQKRLFPGSQECCEQSAQNEKGIENVRVLLESSTTLAEDNTVSFDNFPYACSSDVRTRLLSAFWSHICAPAAARARLLPLRELSPEILLYGPPQTERYQEALVRAVAHECGADVIALTYHSLESAANCDDATMWRRVLDKMKSEDKGSNEDSDGVVAIIGDGPDSTLGPRILRLPLRERTYKPSSKRVRVDSSSKLGVGPSDGGKSGSNSRSSLQSDGAATAEKKKAEKWKDITDVKQWTHVRYNPKGDRATYAKEMPPPGTRGVVVIEGTMDMNYLGVVFSKPFPGGVRITKTCPPYMGAMVSFSDIEPEDEAETLDTTEVVVESVRKVLKRLFVARKRQQEQKGEKQRPLIVLLSEVETFKSPQNVKALITDVINAGETLGFGVVVAGTTTLDTAQLLKAHYEVLAESKGSSEEEKWGPLDKDSDDVWLQDQISMGKRKIMDTLMRFDIDGLSPSFDVYPSAHRSSSTDASSPESSFSNRDPAWNLSLLFRTLVSTAPPLAADQGDVYHQRLLLDARERRAESNLRMIVAAVRRLGFMSEYYSDPVTVDEKALATLLRNREMREHVLTDSDATVIVQYALSAAEKQSGPIVVDPQLVKQGLRLLVGLQPTVRSQRLSEVVPENTQEEELLKYVLVPEDVSLSFSDIGALESVKEKLREAIMLPLQRPELFRRGNLTKPTKGILLFGPPGTGKTMLARAVATESGANFLPVYPSALMSKYSGQSVRAVQAVFSLAKKLSPVVIFVDEIDSLLMKRGKGSLSDERQRELTNEFMLCWDGLASSKSERILVLATTNRPQDLDDAVLRRLSKRIQVDLPDTHNREQILKLMLKSAALAPDVDIPAIAARTEGFTGSDLHILCTKAAHGPVRDLLAKERSNRKLRESQEVPRSSTTEGTGDAAAPRDKKDLLVESAKAPCRGEDRLARIDKHKEEEEKNSADSLLRPLSMKDFEEALAHTLSSVSDNSAVTASLKKWNEMYGDSASKNKQTPLSIYL